MEKKLGILKEKVVSANNFKEPLEYFFDNLAEDPDFKKLGIKKVNKGLGIILTKIGKKMYGPKTKVRNLMLVELPKHHFVHGVCLIGDKMANVIFFKNIDKGMLSILTSLQTGEISFIRFSAVVLETSFKSSISLN